MKYAKMGNRNILYNTYEKFIILLEEEKKIIVDTIKTSKNYDSNTIDKGIFKGVKKNEVGNFLNAGMVGNKLAVDIEDKIKKDYQNGDYSIKAMLYMDPPKEKSLLRKLGEKMNLIQDDNDFK